MSYFEKNLLRVLKQKGLEIFKALYSILSIKELLGNHFPIPYFKYAKL